MDGCGIDPTTGRLTVTDRAALAASLDTLPLVERPLALTLLGDHDDAGAMAQRFDATDHSEEQWRWALVAAELSWLNDDMATADRLLAKAVNLAPTDGGRGVVYQYLGRRYLTAGALATAARWFELARAAGAAGDPDPSWPPAVALASIRAQALLDAVVIAGGRGLRLGGSELGDKAETLVAGRRLLDHALDTVAVATTTVVIGPSRPVGRSVRWGQEEPPGAGPPAALAASLDDVEADRVIVTGVDTPALAPGIDALRAAHDDHPTAPVAALVSDDDGPQPLAALWRADALRDAIARHPTSLRSMFHGVEWLPVPDRGQWADDVDTPADAARLAARLPGC